MTAFERDAFRLVPAVYRRQGRMRCCFCPSSGAVASPVPAFLAVGCGAVRTVTAPNVTAAVTMDGGAIQAEHALRALERLLA